jgi:hypothetical protein
MEDERLEKDSNSDGVVAGSTTPSGSFIDKGERLEQCDSTAHFPEVSASVHSCASTRLKRFKTHL